MNKLILTFTTCWVLLGFATAFAAPVALDKIVATVNDDVITEKELSYRVNSVVEQMKKQGTGLPEANTLNQQVLDRLIEQTLAIQAGEKAGITVTPADVDKAIEAIAKQNRTDKAGLLKMVQEDGISEAQFRADLRKEILISRTQQQLVGSGIHLNETEVAQWVSRQKGVAEENRRYLFGHILIALPQDPTPEQKEQAQARAKQVVDALKQGQDFSKVALKYSDSRDVLERTDLGWRNAEELPSILSDIAGVMEKDEVAGPLMNSSGLHIVKLLDLQAKSQNSPQWVEQAHVRHILIGLNQVRDEKKARAEIDAVIAQLNAGKDFAELAKAYSDDPGSKQSGGDLGWVDAQSLTPAFAQAMQTLKIGQRSEPVLTPYGWHVIEVLDRKRKDISQDRVRTEVQRKLYDRKYLEALQNWYTQLRDQALVDVYQ